MLPHLFSFFLLLASVTSCKQRSSQQNQTTTAFSAQVLFNDSIHDFGTFSAGSPMQRHVFSFVNKGNVPAVILSVDPSCRCISAEYTREAVQPGKSGKVEVTFDGTQSVAGYFNKSIRVRINSSHTYVLKVEGCMK